MKKPYSDLTSQHAVGKVHAEWKQMAKTALILRRGLCDQTWAEAQYPKFTGIFERLLTDPIKDVEIAAGQRTSYN